MARASFCAAVLLILCSLPEAAASGPRDVAGAWNMSYTTRDGQKLASTLTLKVEGATLTGTISSPRGSVPVTDITLNGDEIAFAVVRVGFGDNIRITYAGKIKGETMKLKMKAGPREPLDVVVRRAAKQPG
jgi:hypothetical protein